MRVERRGTRHGVQSGTECHKGEPEEMMFRRQMQAAVGRRRCAVRGLARAKALWQEGRWEEKKAHKAGVPRPRKNMKK